MNVAEIIVNVRAVGGLGGGGGGPKVIGFESEVGARSGRDALALLTRCFRCVWNDELGRRETGVETHAEVAAAATDV